VTELEAKDRRIAELEARVVELEAQVRELLAQLGRNSLNSSLPPSRDSAEARANRTRKTKSKRRRGGQKGHKRSVRELAPPEKVDETYDIKPMRCDGCDRRLHGDDPSPALRQVTEIPEIVALITEYRIHTLECPCGHRTRAEVPTEAAGCFGPRLNALVALLTGGYRVSKRNVQELLGDVLGVDLALGSVSKLEARASEVLAVPHAEVLAHVRSAPNVNMDETSWTQDRSKAWLWVASTPDAVYYQIESERSSQVVTDILGPDFAGIVGNDRAKAYLVLEPENRQVCWFHLGRNFQSKIELGGDAARFGEQMRAFERRMWRAHHSYEADEITADSYKRRMAMVRSEVQRALEQWSSHAGDGIAGMCKNLLGIEPAMWTFVSNPDVAPTNNRAERDIRHPVVWRRSSFGTDSLKGSRFVERILSVVQTCKRQGHRAFKYLTNALSAARDGLAIPPLLPSTA
jgi:transposase